MDHTRISADAQLRERAARVIPGGMWGHLNAAKLPANYPQYFVRGEGCHLWDADGRELIDFMCAWGPMILGYSDPDVEAAANAQRRQGDVLNGPSARLVELAELMVGTVAHADWAMFQKNGTDATTTCAMIARAAQGRRKILVARGAYHGAVPWCNPYPQGSTAEDRAHLITYDYNDSASLERAVAEAGDDLAGIFVSAFKHDLGKPHELPSPAFAKAARALCDRSGAALILDDVRAGFRLHMGGSWETMGVKPDLAAWSKAIANGHALAAVTGNDRFRQAAAHIFITGSFWTASVAMAASLATIAKLKAIDGPAIMRRMGERLRAGLDAQARAHGVALRQSGPPQMPVILFDDDPERRKGWLFCSEALKRGVYMHAAHTMFLSAAHSEADIDRALEATDQAFAEVARQFG
ncbi:aminotransferase class III-fold pyridoxal phosphate-dependent enzyme [Taklimakanibacter lacteus]|uniref:aminotransferase class III-fold pyridoxal phosphate-dependent enzyme n=1 Tax=Taklimakanibacter lacteus TaxID=2268456 RepID=UPI000E66D410